MTDRGDLTPFLEACAMATEVLKHRAVAERWSEASALEGFTVGGVATHLYAATRRFEKALDEELPDSPEVVGLVGFYGLNRVEAPADLEDGLHRLVREDAEKRAGRGPEAVTGRFQEVVARLSERLPGEPPERLVPVWTVEGGATPLPDYLATRVVELVVHADDLAVSAGLPDLEIPEAAASVVIDAFVALALARVGALAVIRAFARAERAHDEALRVL